MFTIDEGVFWMTHPVRVVLSRLIKYWMNIEDAVILFYGNGLKMMSWGCLGGLEEALWLGYTLVLLFRVYSSLYLHVTIQKSNFKHKSCDTNIQESKTSNYNNHHCQTPSMSKFTSSTTYFRIKTQWLATLPCLLI